jgi:hypothetical protein
MASVNYGLSQTGDRREFRRLSEPAGAQRLESCENAPLRDVREAFGSEQSTRGRDPDAVVEEPGEFRPSIPLLAGV